MATSSPGPASSSGRPDRDADQIEADVAATRDRLTGGVGSLVDRVHPQRVKQREVASAKHFLSTEVESAKALLYNARGDLRTDRLAAAGGAVGGVVGFLLVLRALVRRRRRTVTGPVVTTEVTVPVVRRASKRRR